MPVSWHAKIGEFLGGWPADVLVIDTETTGLDLERDWIVEFGWVQAAAGEVVDSCAVILDWTLPAYARYHADIRRRMEETARSMAARGRTYRFSFDGLAGGADPKETLGDCAALIGEAAAAGMAVSGHNIWKFDRLMINWNVWRIGLGSVAFPARRVFDTMLIEKARGLKLVPPEPGSMPVTRWYDQVADNPKRPKCNLDDHCNSVYGLDVDDKQTHSAEYDCLLVHRLLAKMSELSAPLPAARKVAS